MWLPQVLLLLFVTYSSSQNVQVNTPLGKILGSTLTTRLGKTIYAFRGVRYAKPPINNLRFKPPVPVEQWTNIYNATVDGPVCPQPSDDPISEDCLFLNVYTTKFPQDGKSNPRRPVIIFIHAGGFYSVTGRSNWVGPQYFMDQDIVLVTINYRLGSLGFISVGKEAPGNNGLRDQVVAMKWVKNNIEAFGGDPSSVTLFGYSAGAISITLHMVSPMSRGLFHKAILSSEAGVGPAPLPRNQLDLAKRQARIVGCPDASPKVIIDCLKTKSAEELGNSLPQFAEFGNNPVIIWTAVIEEDFGQERFLTEHPIKLINSGRFEKVPVLAGITKDEFAHKAFSIVDNATLLQELNDHFDKYAPICFGYERNTDKSREVSQSIRHFYLGNKTLTKASLTGLDEAFADSITGFPVNRAVELLSEKNPNHVYYYEFTYQGRYSHVYLPGSNKTIPYGVVHHDDLIYLFYISPMFPFFDSTFPERKMVDKLASLWANFAKNGKPISASGSKLKWTPYDNCSKKYMDIGENLQMKDHLFENRYSLWRKLHPLSEYL
jgi:carboxylesterase type B